MIEQIVQQQATSLLYIHAFALSALAIVLTPIAFVLLRASTRDRVACLDKC